MKIKENFYSESLVISTQENIEVASLFIINIPSLVTIAFRFNFCKMGSYTPSLRSKKSFLKASKRVPSMNFVIAGGSYGAINAVKIITQKIIPQARRSNSSFQAKVTVIAPNTESFWNIASVRVLAKPEIMETNYDQLFFNLEETLKQYIPEGSRNELEVLQGKVISVNSSENMITYLPLNNEGKSRESRLESKFVAQTISYDTLVLATGASSSSPAFKLNGSSFQTKMALLDLSEEIKQASTLCIVGAGAVGVELAGELGHKYGKTKKISLYSGVKGTLECMKPKTSNVVIQRLKALGVQTILDVRAVSAYKEDVEVFNSSNSTQLTGFDNNFTDEYESDTLLFNSPKSAGNERSNSPQSNLEPDETFLSNRITGHSEESIISEDTAISVVPFQKILSNEMKCCPSSHQSSHSSASPTNQAKSKPSIPQKKSKQRTVVVFDNGYREAFDCYIPATGNTPNSSYLPYDSLDEQGYVLTDPFLRMLKHNPYGNIYVFGDLVCSGKHTLLDTTIAQKSVLQKTLQHDIIDSSRMLKKYKPDSPTYLVPVSKQGGVGVAFGIPVPSFVVTVLKGKNFLLERSGSFLGE